MKYLIIYPLLLWVILSQNFIYSQNTPAGLSSDYQLNMWLCAEDISGVSDGDLLSVNWSDRSGNNYDASQSSVSNQPTYEENEINGFPVVRFDGQDDLLDDLHNYDARTVFAVYRMSSADQQVGDLGQIWGNYADGVHVAPDPRGGIDGFSFDGQTSSGTAAKYAMNGAAYTGFATNSSVQKWDYDEFEIVAVEFQSTQTINRQVLGSLHPQFSIGDHQLGADIAEIIVFEDQLGETQRILVENYLSTKYNLTISNDYYAYQGTHKYDLAGIGRETAGSVQSETYSAGILGLKESDALSSGEYALMAHDNGAVNTWSSSGTPFADCSKLARTWKVDLTGVVGETQILLDTSDLPALPGSGEIWTVLVSNDADFTTGVSTYLLTENLGVYESEALQLSDGDYISIASVAPSLTFTQNIFSANESQNSIDINIALNVALTDTTRFTLQSTDSTALVLADYTAVDSVFYILPGDTLFQFELAISNDTIVESDEHIKLSLQPENTSLFSDQTALATINDDDNPRKVSFQFASLSGPESAGTVPVNVVLNSVDSTNSTTVNYRVKSATADSVSDFTITTGTLSFPAFSSSQSFNINIVDDALYEPNEDIVIELFQPTNSNLSANDPVEFTYTILDDDAMPSLSFVESNKTKNEGNYTFMIPVELSAASGTSVSYAYDLKGGTATPGSDFSFSSGTSIIASGNTSDSISIQISEDTYTEVDETVVLSIRALTGAGTASDSIYTLTIRDNDIFGFTGPGGVGDSSLNALWLDAGNITGISSGNAINTSWPDASGNNRTVSQGTAARQPKYIENAVNSLPVVRFDGSDDFFDNTYSYDAASAIVVLRVNSSDQITSHLAQLFGNYDEGHFAVDPRSGGNNRGMSFDGGTSERGRYRINGGDYTAYGNDNNSEQWSYDQFFILTGDFENVLTFSRMVIGSLYPSFGVGSHQFGGDIAEMIVFQNPLNEAQNTIIENYLAAKYDISISNDAYAYELTHSFDVAGVGRATVNDIHVNAQSSGILKLSNPSALTDGSYIFAGHDNQAVNSWESMGAPNQSTRILERSWRVDATDTTVELNFSIDTSSLPALNSGFEAWVLLKDEDGDFTSGSSYYLLELNSDGEYEAAGVEVRAGDYLSIGSVKNISAQSGNFNSASSWVSGVPGSSDTAIVAANHTVTLTSNQSSAHVHLSQNGRIELASNVYSIAEGSMEIYGTMDMGSGTINYSASGDQLIANVVYNHLRIEGTGSKTLSNDLVVNGNLILNAATLDLNNSGDYTLQVAGNWVNNGGSLEPRNGTVDLNGSGAQDITTNGEGFYNFRVSGTGPYNLQDDLELSNQLMLEGGIISTSSNELFVNNTSGSAIPSYSNTSFVNGNLKRGVGFGIFDYIFPVGNGLSSTNYHPAEVSPDMLVGVSTVTAYFTDLVRHDDVDMSATDSWLTYESISPDGMWVISPNQQPTGGVYSVKLYLDNMTGLQDNQFGVIKRPEGASGASEWQALGNLNAMNGLGRLLSDGYALRTGLTSFSEFGMGSGSDSGDPLPVELMYIDAQRNGEQIDLNWATASEINADYFEIQRSENGVDFNTLGKQKAQGNSIDLTEYQFVDLNPANGNNYYRIKQVDFDGQYEYLPVRVVNFEAQSEPFKVKVYPNPGNGKQLDIELKNVDFDTESIHLDVYDIQGKNVYSRGNFTGEIQRINFSKQLQKGVYIIDIHIGKQQQKVKWIIN